MNREETSLNLFNSGFNCAQSVLTSFKDKTNVSKDDLLKISCGLGAGMGRLQQTCGAVTGAYLVIGLINGYDKPEDKNLKEKTYTLVKKFDNAFKSLYSTTNCRELLKCDLNTEEGKIFFKDYNLINEVCAKCVKDAVIILEKLLN